MKRALLLLAALAIILPTGRAACQEKIYPYRFVYVHGKALENMEQVELIRKLAKTASEHGLNGLILDAMFDRLPLDPPYNIKNLMEIKRICDSYGIELIPTLMGMGYNAPLQTWDKNLIEGLPIRDALFVVKNGLANIVADPPVSIPNGGFEEADGSLPAGWTPTASKGVTVALDKAVFMEGKSSLRVEITDQIVDLSEEFRDFNTIMHREIPVHPYRCYVLTCRVKTEGLERGGDVFPMLVQGPDGRRLQFFMPTVPTTSDGWVQAKIGFNSINYDRVRISVGAPSSKTGKLWIDSYEIAEEGLVNVIRREGTPVTVRSDKTGQLYMEGRDYARIEDPLKTLMFDHEAPPIRIIPGGFIEEGERLRVSFYNNYPIYNGQTPACISEPRTHEIWRKVATMLDGLIQPKKYYLGMDELRLCGSCETCKARGMTPGELAGDCITRQVDIVRSINPEAEILIWSDMFDPNHNAPGDYMKGDYYYHVDGTFEGSWKYLPKDVVVVCWYAERRDKSLAHFSKLGFRTLGSSSGDLDRARGWLKSLDDTPNAMGIMFTTWSENFEILSQFGDLVNRKIK